MNTHREQLADLVEQADRLENGPGKIALLEEAVRIADSHGDIAEGFRIRQLLISASEFGGRPELTLVAFSWCLSEFDRDPEAFNLHGLLWKYKWVVTTAVNFPQISRSKIDELLDDMEERFRQYGSTLNAVHHKRRSVAKSMGDREKAIKANQMFNRTARDELSDCAACVADSMIEYYQFLNKPAEAVKYGMKVLKGNLTCATVPHRTYSNLLLPMIYCGRAEEAMDYHVHHYNLVARHPGLLASAMEHVLFLAMTCNLSRAMKLWQSHFPSGLATSCPSTRFEVLRKSLFLLERLKMEGKETLKLRLPSSVGFHRLDGKYTLEEIQSWTRREAESLADQFDQRNGNRHESQQLAAIGEWHEYCQPVPLSTTRRKQPGEAETSDHDS